MSSAKEIRTKIQSIGKTQKTTRAMEMVAASKIRKAQEKVSHSRPFANKIIQVIHHLGAASPEYKHSFLSVREKKRVGYIVVSSDRGLCGGLNNNLFKTVVKDMQRFDSDGIEIDICAIGSKAQGFFRRFGGHVVATADHLGDNPEIKDLIGLVKVMLDSYSDGKLDALYVVSNVFVNKMKQDPTITQLLPIEPEEGEKKEKHHWDYIYEPDAHQLIDQLLIRFIESQVYQAVVENIASEHAARMVAMKNATENAGELIHELQLIYNKARQSAITQELSEIVAGAAAV